MGVVQSAWAIGWGGATLVFAFLFSILPQELAWRALFWTGLAPALLIFYIRRSVRDSEVFTAVERPAAMDLRKRVFVIFSSGMLRLTIVASLLTTGTQGGYYALNTWLPTFLRVERKLSILDSSGYLGPVILGAFCGALTAAHLADWIGRKKIFALFALAAVLITGLYMLVPVNNHLMLFLGFPLGFASNGIFAPMGAFLTELFPTTVRGTTQGFSFNVGRAIGAGFPAMVGFLSESMGLGRAIGVFTIAAYAILLSALVMLPETRGRELCFGEEPELRRTVRTFSREKIVQLKKHDGHFSITLVKPWSSSRSKSRRSVPWQRFH